jgi:hypothetical protein
MYTFWLVIKDLFWFVLGKDGRDTDVSGVEQLCALPVRPVPHLIAEAAKPVLLSTGSRSMSATVQSESVPELTAAVARDFSDAEPDVPVVDMSKPYLHAPVVMYVCKEIGTNRSTAPQQEFDGVVERVPYGAAVTVVGYRGRYASVLRGGHTGWIFKDDLSPDKHAVWPQFVVRHEYLSTESDTIKLRAIIEDVFGAGVMALPLQAGEYIMFRLLMEHRTIDWPQTRPRLPGLWQTILRGVPGIHATISPKTDSIMEWNTEHGEGRLAYVEAVSPDNTIALTLVGRVVAGQYETCTMLEEEWRELRPVFIEVA